MRETEDGRRKDETKTRVGKLKSADEKEKTLTGGAGAMPALFIEKLGAV